MVANCALKVCCGQTSAQAGRSRFKRPTQKQYHIITGQLSLTNEIVWQSSSSKVQNAQPEAIPNRLITTKSAANELGVKNLDQAED
jgi:hypothetical protein